MGDGSECLFPDSYAAIFRHGPDLLLPGKRSKDNYQ